MKTPVLFGEIETRNARIGVLAPWGPDVLTRRAAGTFDSGGVTPIRPRNPVRAADTFDEALVDT